MRMTTRLTTRLTTIAIATWCATLAMAGDAVVTRFVDLREPNAFAELKKTNPAHLEKIRLILAGLQEKPERVEGDWLQATFAARDVDLSRMVFQTSYPPKQLLQFSLDDVHYTMNVVRRDLVR